MKKYFYKYKEIFIISFIFLIVYIFNIDSLRFIRDDWANLSVMKKMIDNDGIRGALWQIMNNEWLSASYIPRIFFFSWWIEFFNLIIFKFNALPYYFFILSLHFIEGIFVFYILKKILDNKFISLLGALFFIVTPTSSNVLFWLNNWFFSMPMFFFILYLLLYFYPRNNKIIDYVVLTITIILCQFSGEQIIPMIYIMAPVFILRSYYKNNRKFNRQELLRIVSPFFIAFIALVVYVKFIIVTEPGNENYQVSWPIIKEYYRGMYRRIISFYYDSERYGFGSVYPSLKTLLLTAITAVISGLVFFKEKSNQFDKKKIATMIKGLIIVLVASSISLLYGAISGSRPGVESRYVYIPGLLIATTIPLVIYYFIHNKRIRIIACWIIFIYFSLLNIYMINDVWGLQKEVDYKIWSEIDGKITPQVKYILTDNLTQAQLTPHYYSDAVSDFQADWGIFGRLMVEKGQKVTVVKEAIEQEDGKLKLAGYYGTDFASSKEEVLFLVYRYGEDMGSLTEAKLYSFDNFEDYIKFKNNENSIEVK